MWKSREVLEEDSPVVASCSDVWRAVDVPGGQTLQLVSQGDPESTCEEHPTAALAQLCRHFTFFKCHSSLIPVPSIPKQSLVISIFTGLWAHTVQGARGPAVPLFQGFPLSPDFSSFPQRGIVRCMAVCGGGEPGKEC